RRRHRHRRATRRRAQGLRHRRRESRRSGWQLQPFLVHLSHRPRRPPARADAVRTHRRRLRPRRAHPAARTVKALRWIVLALVAAVTGVCAWAAIAPVTFASREELFEIPKGTWARRMCGDKVEILPARIDLTLGIHDVLLLRNLDDVPQVFGPTVM